MPGFDGTGPQGQGPMTGGGFGRCTDNAGYGMRPRFGRGGGWGRRGNAAPSVSFGTAGFQGQLNPMGGMPDRQLLDSRIASLTQELEQLKKQRTHLDGSENNAV